MEQAGTFLLLLFTAGLVILFFWGSKGMSWEERMLLGAGATLLAAASAGSLLALGGHR